MPETSIIKIETKEEISIIDVAPGLEYEIPIIKEEDVQQVHDVGATAVAVSYELI